MILSGKEIKKRLDKDIFIDPFDENRLNPNSYNLRLHDELIIYDDDLLLMNIPNRYHKIKIPEDGYIMQPNKLYLGRTIEYTRTENLIPMLEGRSSVGRLGLFVHVTAGFGDVGFSGYWTLELFCVQPIKIFSNVDICQIYYHTISGDFERYNSGKYQRNNDIQPSMLYKDFK